MPGPGMSLTIGSHCLTSEGSLINWFPTRVQNKKVGLLLKHALYKHGMEREVECSGWGEAKN